MKKLLFLLFTITLTMTACRLDSFLYNPTETDTYLLNDFKDDPHFTLDSNYDIDESMIHLMELESGPSSDRETIHAVYVGDITRISTDTVILYCHGNGGNLDYYWQRVKLLAHVGWKHRFGVLMMDYRGYGRSTGEPTEDGMYYDVDACMKWLEDNGLTSERLVMKGFSLGCAPATELTANPRTLQPSKLILEAPFASYEYLAQSIAHVGVAGSWYANLVVDNAEEIKKVEEPFLWMHGEADHYIGVQNGQLVADNYQGSHLVKRRVPNADHSTVPLIMGFEAYIQLIEGFITGKI